MAFNLMFLGDSITHGVVNKSDTESGGYRTELWNLFQADRFNVDFVGLQSNGPSNIDRNHHGHRGWRIDEVMFGNTRIAGQDQVGNIDNWLDATNPNVTLPNAVFLMLGTNDVLQDFQLNNAPARLGQLIDKIFNKVPDTQIFVSSLLPITNTTDNQQAQAFNSQLPGLINTKKNAGKNITFVDINKKVTTNDLADGVHPTIDGFTKIANAWYDAFLPSTNIQKTTRIQAENMTLSNYIVESNNTSALGRKLIGLESSAITTGTASYQFSGTAGKYDVVVGYYDENDGQSNLSVKIGGTQVDSWTLNKNLGSGAANNQTKTRKTVATGIQLNPGTSIEITGTKNQSEFARMDYIELIPNLTSTPSTQTSLSVNNIATKNGTNHTFSVTYTSSNPIDVSTLDSSDVRVTGPNNFSQLATLVSVNNSNNGSPRTATYRINAAGGSWDEVDNGTYTVTLQNNQVEDINDNFFAGSSLGTFQVNVPQSTIRLEAENMQRTNFRVESNSIASNGQFVSLYQASSSIGSISSTFNGESGFYDVMLRYVDENDGSAILTTSIGGNQIDQRTLNQNLGYSSVNIANTVTQTISQALWINQGESIQIQGVANKGEFLRVDYIGFKEVNLTPSSVTVDGTEAADTLTGGSESNTIRGYGNSDLINGGGGNDTLIGGGGIDTLIGDGGNDVFALEVDSDADIISDFVDGQDRLGLSGSLTFDQLTISQGTNNDQNNTLIKVTNSNETLAILTGVQASNISFADFTSF